MLKLRVRVFVKATVKDVFNAYERFLPANVCIIQFSSKVFLKDFS